MTSEFCGTGSTLQLAQPQDLQIVCNIRTQEPQPQGLLYPQTFKIIEILEIINHPNYRNLEKDREYSTGPIAGHDISVYKVNDTNFAVEEGSIWPACLPQDKKKKPPIAVVIGGEAALLSLVIASSSVDLVGPLLGAGVSLAGLGLGGMAMAMNACQCRSRLTRQCCPLETVRGQRICPPGC